MSWDATGRARRQSQSPGTERRKRASRGTTRRQGRAQRRSTEAGGHAPSARIPVWPARNGKAAKAAQQPLEHRILLTATLCLLAFGAVMVYSASSASSLLEGSGTGSGDLVKFVIFGAVGLALMHYLARDGVARVQGLIAPLLAVSFALVLAVHIPHVGVSVNGARRWIGPGIFQFSPPSF